VKNVRGEQLAVRAALRDATTADDALASGSRVQLLAPSSVDSSLSTAQGAISLAASRVEGVVETVNANLKSLYGQLGALVRSTSCGAAVAAPAPLTVPLS
jgi:hypothetical protein